MVKLFFLGKDKRSECLKELYKNDVNIVEDMSMAEYIIFPIPFTKDKEHITGTEILIEDIIKKCINKTIFSGGIPKDIRRKLEMNNVSYVDLMDLDEVAYLNAIPTAEGAILKAMELKDTTIHGSNVLVIGFGRCGKIIADKLKGLNANVFCMARKKKDLAHIFSLGYNVVDIKQLPDYLGKMDIIFSTVPTIILNEKNLKYVNPDAVIIDIASSPGSVDYVETKKLNLNATLELGIPTKQAPKSAAKYIKNTIDDVIYNRG